MTTEMLGPDEDQENDEVPEMPPSSSIFTPEMVEAVMQAKRAEPSKFASYWEMDEDDIDEATEEEIQNDPVKRTLWAAETNNVEILKEMISSNNDFVMAKDADGYTPLHRASYGNHLEAMQVLLEAGAEVDARTNDQWTPLHSTCRWDQTEAAELLLACGADINARTTGNQTALHLACANAATGNTLRLLLMNRYIDVTVKNKMGETAHDICVRSNPYSGLFEIAEDHICKLQPS